VTQDEVLEQHLSRAAERAERLRREASSVLERAVARASAHGWSQRRIGAAVGRSQPEVHRLLRAAPPVEVAETAMHGASREPAGSAVIELVLTERRDAIVAAAARRGVRNHPLVGSVARGEDTVDSDVDLLVDVAPGVGLFQLGALEVELRALIGRAVDIVPADSLREDVARTVDSIPL
jgi:predicted nucleotidyltransferase